MPRTCPLSRETPERDTETLKEKQEAGFKEQRTETEHLKKETEAERLKRETDGTGGTEDGTGERQEGFEGAGV